MSAVLFAALAVTTSGWAATGLRVHTERRWRVNAEDDALRALADLDNATRRTPNP